MKARETFALTYRLLPPAQRRRFVLLVLMSLLGAALESVSVGVVIPVVAAVAGTPKSDGLLGQLYGLFGPTSLGWACAALLCVFAVKNAYLLLMQYVQFRFIYSRQATVGRQLLASFLEAPYVEHARRSSATALSQINDDVRYAHQVALQTAFTLVSEIAVGVLIAALLLLLAPLVAAAALAVFGLAGVLITVVMRRRIEGFGARQQREHGSMNRHVIQALRSLKQTKLSGKERYFVASYSESAERFARSMRVYRVTTTAPRHVLEALAIAALVGTLLVGNAAGLALPQLVPLLALFVVAAVRLMPSVSRLVQAVTTLRYFARSVYVVHERLGDAHDDAPTAPREGGASGSARGNDDDDDSEALALREAVSLRGVTFCYPDAERAALEQVDLTVRRGEIIGLVGESGAGKSTLADVLLGLLRPGDGELNVDGEAVADDVTLRRWQRSLGVVPQPVYLTDDTLRRNVAFACPDGDIDDARVERALRAARLWDFVEALPEGLDFGVGEDGARLSGGERQRVGIARALYGEPTLLVMDEGTAALDYRNEREIALAVSALAGGGMTVVIIAHRLSTLKLCERLVMLREGRVVASGSFDELAEGSPPFRELIGG